MAGGARLLMVIVGLLAFGAGVVKFGVLDPSRREPRPEAAPTGSGPAAEAAVPQVGPASPAPEVARPEPIPEAGGAVRVAGAAPTAGGEQSAPATLEPVGPSFDLVRVEPSGESVIAGRGPGGAMVEMLRNGEVHARTVADPSGLFALVPPLLPVGSHEIVLQSIAPNGVRARSRESVTVEIASRRDTKPLVALTSPDRPTVVLSTPEPLLREAARTPSPPVQGPSEEAKPPPPSPTPARTRVRVASVEAEEGGRLFVSGKAPAGATVRLYLNETFVAPGGAGTDGSVSFAIGRGVKPGSYRVRLDEVDPVSGEVRSRAEVPFTVPAPIAPPLPPAADPYVTYASPAVRPDLPPAGGGQSEAPARPLAEQPTLSTTTPRAALPRTAPAPSGGALPVQDGPLSTAAAAPSTPRELDPATVLVPEVNTAIVSRGDTLWTISRRVYGRGVRFTTIYGANQEQIRNPGLIYPGQAFVLPPEMDPKSTR